jgi:hypothetical protein
MLCVHFSLIWKTLALQARVLERGTIVPAECRSSSNWQFGASSIKSVPRDINMGRRTLLAGLLDWGRRLAIQQRLRIVRHLFAIAGGASERVLGRFIEELVGGRAQLLCPLSPPLDPISGFLLIDRIDEGSHLARLHLVTDRSKSVRKIGQNQCTISRGWERERDLDRSLSGSHDQQWCGEIVSFQNAP